MERAEDRFAVERPEDVLAAVERPEDFFAPARPDDVFAPAARPPEDFFAAGERPADEPDVDLLAVDLRADDPDFFGWGI